MRQTPSRLAHSVVVACCLPDGPQWLAICGGVLVALAGASFAAETNAEPQPVSQSGELRLEDLIKLEIPTVEGASKYSQKTTEAPSSVTILTADDVKKYGYRNLAD